MVANFNRVGNPGKWYRVSRVRGYTDSSLEYTADFYEQETWNADRAGRC